MVSNIRGKSLGLLRNFCASSSEKLTRSIRKKIFKEILGKI